MTICGLGTNLIEKMIYSVVRCMSYGYDTLIQLRSYGKNFININNIDVYFLTNYFISNNIRVLQSID